MLNYKQTLNDYSHFIFMFVFLVTDKCPVFILFDLWFLYGINAVLNYLEKPSTPQTTPAILLHWFVLNRVMLMTHGITQKKNKNYRH